LDVLGGNRNEILNDVLKYLRTNISSSSSAFLSPQYLLNSENCNNRISSTTNANEFLHNANNNNNKTNLNKVNNNNNNLQERLNTSTSRVTFEEFIKAAEIVLERRKQKKITNDHLTNNSNNNGVQVRHIDANNRPHVHSLNRNSSGGNITNNNSNNNTLTPNNNIYNLSHVSSSSLNNLNSKSNYYMLHAANANVAGTEAQQENVNSHIHLASDTRIKMSQNSSKNNINNIGIYISCSFYLFI